MYSLDQVCEAVFIGICGLEIALRLPLRTLELISLKTHPVQLSFTEVKTKAYRREWSA